MVQEISGDVHEIALVVEKINASVQEISTVVHEINKMVHEIIPFDLHNFHDIFCKKIWLPSEKFIPGSPDRFTSEYPARF